MKKFFFDDTFSARQSMLFIRIPAISDEGMQFLVGPQAWNIPVSFVNANVMAETANHETYIPAIFCPVNDVCLRR